MRCRKRCLIEVTVSPDTPKLGVVGAELACRSSPPFLPHFSYQLPQSGRRVSPCLAQWEAAAPSNQSTELSGEERTVSQAVCYH